MAGETFGGMVRFVVTLEVEVAAMVGCEVVVIASVVTEKIIKMHACNHLHFS